MLEAGQVVAVGRLAVDGALAVAVVAADGDFAAAVLPAQALEVGEQAYPAVVLVPFTAQGDRVRRPLPERSEGPD